MFTVEFDHDATVVTTIDERDMYFDVQMTLAGDNSVLLRQFYDDVDHPQEVYMSYQQLLDLLYSMDSTAGAYYAKVEKKIDSILK